jgi:hypothetical protein
MAAGPDAKYAGKPAILTYARARVRQQRRRVIERGRLCAGARIVSRLLFANENQSQYIFGYVFGTSMIDVEPSRIVKVINNEAAFRPSPIVFP